MSPGQHTLTALVQNEPGALNRLVSVFRRWSLNLSSLAVSSCEQEGFSRLTMVVEDGEAHSVKQCVRQLEKIVDVVEAEDITPRRSVQRELLLLTVPATVELQQEILRIAQMMHCQVLHTGEDQSITLELVGDPVRLDSLVALLTPYGIRRIVRSGLLAIKVED